MFTQTDAFSMGSPSETSMANIFVAFHEKIFIIWVWK